MQLAIKEMVLMSQRDQRMSGRVMPPTPLYAWPKLQYLATLVVPVLGLSLSGLGGVSASRGRVWTFFFRKGEIATVTGNRTIRSRIRGGADGIAASGLGVWVINPLGTTLLDP